jgi:dihydroxyacetone kinase-like protein
MSGLTAALQAAATAAVDHADELNRLDGNAGDGDLGVTMATGARAVLAVLAGLESASPVETLRTCGATLAREAPSTSGTLVATGLLRAARAGGEGWEDDAGTLARLLAAARDGIAERGKASPGEKTMLDALGPAVDAASAAASEGESLAAALSVAATAAADGATATAAMVPRHGRAGWLAERSAGHEDAGARLVAILLTAAAASAASEVP